MLFGKPESFAIEIFDEGLNPKWRGFGRMCLHLAGRPHGDVNDTHCSLWHPVERIEEVARDLPSFWSESFEGHTDQELFAYLDAVLYSGEIGGDVKALGRHEFLTNTSEMFDGEKSFVFCDTRQSVRVIWQDRQGLVDSVHVPRADFEAVVAELSGWFSGIREDRARRV